MSGRSIKNLMGLFFLLGCQALPAADTVSIVLKFVPDPGNGRQVFDTCARCHLPEAWGTEDGTYPQLAGQHLNVLLKQLLDIRTGARRNPLMRPFVQSSIIGGYQNIVDVVAYITALPMAPTHALGPWPEATPEYAQGKEVFENNCATCHGKSGEGDNAKAYPRLQGQHYNYTRRQAIAIKRGLRDTNPGMRAVLDGLSEEDLALALNYVSRLPVPEKDLAPSSSWRNPDFN